MIPSNIDVRIENLVLHGFDDVDGAQIGESLERGLALLLSKGDLPEFLSRNGIYAQRDGGQFEVPRGMEPGAVGLAIARAVIGGVGRSVGE